MRYLKRKCIGFYNQHHTLKGGNPFKLNTKSLDSYRTQQYQASHIFDGTDNTALTLYSSLFYSSSRLCSIFFLSRIKPTLLKYLHFNLRWPEMHLYVLCVLHTHVHIIHRYGNTETFSSSVSEAGGGNYVDPLIRGL